MEHLGLSDPYPVGYHLRHPAEQQGSLLFLSRVEKNLGWRTSWIGRELERQWKERAAWDSAADWKVSFGDNRATTPEKRSRTPAHIGLAAQSIRLLMHWPGPGVSRFRRQAGRGSLTSGRRLFRKKAPREHFMNGCPRKPCHMSVHIPRF